MRMFVLLFSALAACAMPAFDAGFAGDWTSTAGGFRIVDHVRTTTKGWSDFADSVSRMPRYDISIATPEGGISMTFPRGQANMLTSIVPYVLDSLPHKTAVARGGFWTIYDVRGASLAGTVRLHSLIYSEWSKPDTNGTHMPQDTDANFEFTLELENPDVLLLHGHLSDEKGMIVYTQRFHRAQSR